MMHSADSVGLRRNSKVRIPGRNQLAHYEIPGYIRVRIRRARVEVIIPVVPYILTIPFHLWCLLKDFTLPKRLCHPWKQSRED